MSFKIAIDGPSGAGKSTIAKLLASKLDYIYIDTGAMYRAIAYYMLNNNIKAEETEKIINNLDNINIDVKIIDENQRTYLNGEDISDKIRNQEVSNYASKASTIGEVREKMKVLQQGIAENIDCVMDGRDIGTVILPNADVKIYLDATPEIRAKRRYEELIEKGDNVEYPQILKEIKERDYRDTHREHNPLKLAEDGIGVESRD